MYLSGAAQKYFDALRSSSDEWRYLPTDVQRKMGVLDDEEDDKEDEARQHGALRKVCVFMSESMQGVAKLGLDSKIPPKAIVEMAEGVVVVAVRARHAHWAGQSRSFHQRP